MSLFPSQVEPDGSYRVGDNYPRLCMKPGRVEVEAGSNLWKVTIVKRVAEKNVGHHVAVLTRGPAPFDATQASHRCKNLPQLCANPLHLVWESAIVNKSRDSCDNGHVRLMSRHPIYRLWTFESTSSDPEPSSVCILNRLLNRLSTLLPTKMHRNSLVF